MDVVVVAGAVRQVNPVTTVACVCLMQETVIGVELPLAATFQKAERLQLTVQTPSPTLIRQEPIVSKTSPENNPPAVLKFRKETTTVQYHYF